jgi:DNA-binding protein Fis
MGQRRARPLSQDRVLAHAPLRQVRGNQTEAARPLGVSRKALWEKRTRYGLP